MIIQPLVLSVPRVALILGSVLMAQAQTDGGPPFAFPVEAVSFSNGEVRLAGAILKPEGPGPFPAVVVVHGAGPAFFDEVAFRVHANAFVRSGFAVLLYDKRGSGRSTGRLDAADYADLAADAAPACNFCAPGRTLLPTRLGFWDAVKGAGSERSPRAAIRRLHL